MRWQHPRHGLLKPDDFVPLAERTGLIRPLTMSVLRVALKQSREWNAGGTPLTVAVNLSARNLQDRRLPDDIARHAHAVRRARLRASSSRSPRRRS